MVTSRAAEDVARVARERGVGGGGGVGGVGGVGGRGERDAPRRARPRVLRRGESGGPASQRAALQRTRRGGRASRRGCAARRSASRRPASVAGHAKLPTMESDATSTRHARFTYCSVTHTRPGCVSGREAVQADERLARRPRRRVSARTRRGCRARLRERGLPLYPRRAWSDASSPLPGSTASRSRRPSSICVASTVRVRGS